MLIKRILKSEFKDCRKRNLQLTLNISYNPRYTLAVMFLIHSNLYPNIQYIFAKQSRKTFNNSIKFKNTFNDQFL